MESRNSLINTGILVLILVVVLVIGVTLVTSVRHITIPIEEVGQSLREQVAAITQPTPTIIPDPITIIHEVRSLSRLETASYTIEKVITAESRQGAFGFLFGDRLILVAHGQVIAGVDLSQLTESDISVDQDGRVFVALPPAEVFVTVLNNEQSYIFDRDIGVIGLNPALETEARQAAEEHILEAALEDGILDTAQANAETYLRHLISALGFDEVVFSTSTGSR